MAASNPQRPRTYDLAGNQAGSHVVSCVSHTKRSLLETHKNGGESAPESSTHIQNVVSTTRYEAIHRRSTERSVNMLEQFRFAGPARHTLLMEAPTTPPPLHPSTPPGGENRIPQQPRHLGPKAGTPHQSPGTSCFQRPPHPGRQPHRHMWPRPRPSMRRVANLQPHRNRMETTPCYVGGER